jgi:hypothetical protein
MQDGATPSNTCSMACPGQCKPQQDEPRHITTPHGHAGTPSLYGDIHISQGYTAELCMH